MYMICTDSGLIITNLGGENEKGFSLRVEGAIERVIELSSMKKEVVLWLECNKTSK